MTELIPQAARSRGRIRTTTLTVRVSPSEVATLDAAARAAGTTRSELIRAAVMRLAAEIERRRLGSEAREEDS